MEQITLKLTGTSPLMQHNDQLVDELRPATKRLAEAVAESKAKKTDAARMAMRRAEFDAGIYHDDKIGPYIPSTWIMKSMRDTAALTKKGKGIERGVMPLEDRCAIVYDGPRDLDGLWAASFFDCRAIGVNTAKTMRTRPFFAKWSTTCSFVFEPQLIDRKTLLSFAQQAGSLMGIGDARRLRFGRFDAEAV
ncbi:hypothetical protein K0U83_21815 [bacterium]|nr:hypothetical protein [bacterium]